MTDRDALATSGDGGDGDGDDVVVVALVNDVVLVVVVVGRRPFFLFLSCLFFLSLFNCFLFFPFRRLDRKIVLCTHETFFK